MSDSKSFLDELLKWMKGDSTKNSKYRELWALRDLSLSVNPGQSLGIIGENGSGKSTLLKILARVTWPTEGSAEIYGRVSALLEVGTGFHLELSGRENIFLSGAMLGMRRQEVIQRFDEIVAFSEVEAFLDTPVKHYSSGMFLRLAFAIMSHLNSDVLIIDEILAVGDTKFQKKCLSRIQSLIQQGKTILFVSHQLPMIQNLCAHVLWMSHGRAVMYDRSEVVLTHYQRQMHDNERHKSNGVLLH